MDLAIRYIVEVKTPADITDEVLEVLDQHGGVCQALEQAINRILSQKLSDEVYDKVDITAEEE